MEEACRNAKADTAMAALMPIDAKTAFEVSSQAAQETGLVCGVANVNSSKQVVISGHEAAVDAAIALAKAKGARRAIRLEVSAPFHSQLMAPAATEVTKHLRSVELSDPVIPLISNVSASPVSGSWSSNVS